MVEKKLLALELPLLQCLKPPQFDRQLAYSRGMDLPRW